MRLNFKLEEFVRTSWVSSKAEAVWRPIFQTMSNRFVDIERATLRTGKRKVVLQHTGDIITLTKEMMDEGLSVIPLEKANKTDTYVSATQPFDPSKPYDYKVAIGKAEDAARFAVAYSLQKHGEIGMLLGYPICCQNFFRKIWVKEGWFDTTLPMLAFDEKTVKFYDLDPRNNILLRWLGIRPVSHLPCSFSCGPTREVADDYKEAAKAIGRCEDWKMILEILSWPVEWNSLHGIAQIITPVCKVTTASDALKEKHTIQLISSHMPSEAGTGIDFPFIRDTWTDNGFKDNASMVKAHDTIIEALRPFNPVSVLDLGCGNMELLRRIAREFGSYTFGVDLDKDKQPSHVGDIFNLELAGSDFDFVLCAKQRGQEQPDKWEALLHRMNKSNVRNLLLYDYTTNDIEVRSI